MKRGRAKISHAGMWHGNHRDAEVDNALHNSANLLLLCYYYVT